MMATAKIGSTNREGSVQIVDTRWDSNGTLFVTVRELLGGGAVSWDGGRDAYLSRMRRLARRALEHPEQTRSVRAVREFYADGCAHVTFAVSRLDP